MKKLFDGVYTYKGVTVERLGGTGMYISYVYVKDLKLPIKICGATQASFKRIFNEKVAEYGGLK